MVCAVSGTDYVIVGFSEYLDQFEWKVLPEFKGEAEELLLRELEEKPKDGDNIEIHLDAEKTREKKNMVFPFSCYLSEYPGKLELLFLGYRVKE